MKHLEWDKSWDLGCSCCLLLMKQKMRICSLFVRSIYWQGTLIQRYQCYRDLLILSSTMGRLLYYCWYLLDSRPTNSYLNGIIMLRHGQFPVVQEQSELTAAQDSAGRLPLKYQIEHSHWIDGRILSLVSCMSYMSTFSCRKMILVAVMVAIRSWHIIAGDWGWCNFCNRIQRTTMHCMHVVSVGQMAVSVWRWWYDSDGCYIHASCQVVAISTEQ